MIYSVIVKGKDMTVMENQHETGKTILEKGIVNTRWFLGKLTEINWEYIFEGIREYRVKEGIEVMVKVWNKKQEYEKINMTVVPNKCDPRNTESSSINSSYTRKFVE